MSTSEQSGMRESLARVRVPIEEPDQRAMRDLFGRFLTGVTVVTLLDQAGEPRGFTANSFTSVSLSPPLVLVCIGRNASSYEALCGSDEFAINILADTQRDVASAFGSRAGTKFAGVTTMFDAGRPPLIAGSLASMVCRRENLVEAGDHTIVIGRVLEYRTDLGQPLGFLGGGYTALASDVAALERGHDPIRVGVIAHRDGGILLLQRQGHADWECPSAPLRYGEDHRKVLPKLCADLGIDGGLSALYSVFQEAGQPHTTMLFRVEAARLPELSTLSNAARAKLFHESEEPWRRIASPGSAAAVKRFFVESAASRFGIYWEGQSSGYVAELAGHPEAWVPTSKGLIG